MANSSLTASTYSRTDSVLSTDVEEDIKNYFKDFQKLSEQELLESVEKCKSLIIDSDRSSTQHKWLIRKLVELRYRQIQMTTEQDEPPSSKEVTVSGHFFRDLRQMPSKRIFCDMCTNCIWIFQQFYTCIYCSFNAHAKCVKYIERTCVNMVVSEKGIPETRICPEIGLALQMYRCAECRIQLMNGQFYLEPKKCHYSGLYFCKSCHWNNYSIIPANIIHNWDFEQRPVSRTALQEINLFYERPVIKLETINPKLFVFIQKLGTSKMKRMQLMEMKRYLDVCKFALEGNVLNKSVNDRRYLVEGTDMYSIYDLVCVENCSFFELLNGIIHKFRQHIMACEVRF
jgi:hypothetical protein